MRKAWESVESGGAEIVVCLVPARTDTRWWHTYVTRGEVEFLPGRLRFGGAGNGAPFPSAVVVFRRREMACLFDTQDCHPLGSPTTPLARRVPFGHVKADGGGDSSRT
jgi:site-specific DNA-methyltransferase (adenine-specific)